MTSDKRNFPVLFNIAITPTMTDIGMPDPNKHSSEQLSLAELGYSDIQLRALRPTVANVLRGVLSKLVELETSKGVKLSHKLDSLFSDDRSRINKEHEVISAINSASDYNSVILWLVKDGNLHDLIQKHPHAENILLKSIRSILFSEGASPSGPYRSIIDSYEAEGRTCYSLHDVMAGLVVFGLLAKEHSIQRSGAGASFAQKLADMYIGQLALAIEGSKYSKEAYQITLESGTKDRLIDIAASADSSQLKVLIGNFLKNISQLASDEQIAHEDEVLRGVAFDSFELEAEQSDKVYTDSFLGDIVDAVKKEPRLWEYPAISIIGEAKNSNKGLVIYGNGSTSSFEAQRSFGKFLLSIQQQAGPESAFLILNSEFILDPILRAYPGLALVSLTDKVHQCLNSRQDFDGATFRSFIGIDTPLATEPKKVSEAISLLMAMHDQARASGSRVGIFQVTSEEPSAELARFKDWWKECGDKIKTPIIMASSSVHTTFSKGIGDVIGKKSSDMLSCHQAYVHREMTIAVDSSGLSPHRALAAALCRLGEHVTFGEDNNSAVRLDSSWHGWSNPELSKFIPPWQTLLPTGRAGPWSNISKDQLPANFFVVSYGPDRED